MKASLTQSVMRGAALTFGSRAGLMLANIIALGITARLISPAEFGRFTVIQLLIGILGVFPYAVGQALIRIESKGAAGTGLAIIGLLALIADLLLLALVPVIEQFFNIVISGTELSLVLLTIPLLFLSFLADALVRKNLKFGAATFAETGSQVVGLYFLTCLLALLGFGSLSLLIGLVVQAGLWLAFLCMSGLFGLIDAPTREAIRGYKDAAWFSLMGCASYVALNGDNYVVGRTMDAAALGVYSRAYNLMNKPVNLIGASISNVFYPAVVELRGDRQRLKAAYMKATTAAAFVALPGAALAFLFSAVLVKIVLGDGWTSAIVPFQILSVGLFFRVHVKVAEAVAFAASNVLSSFWRQVVFAIAVIFASALGSRYGLAGVTALVVVAIAAFHVLIVALANKQTQTSILEWVVCMTAPVAITASALLCSIALPSNYFGGSIFVHAIMQGTIFALVFGCGVVATLLVWPSSQLGSLLAPLTRYLPIKRFMPPPVT